ncbi:ATP-binding protein [Ammoniphilus sp. YIM 78166]|uniref:ATP-binding protein n=1 Tax=Ammoniphilus sp. YIM 78166 TaxID=1644106 RepID=UPI001430B1E7|nr:ATP-binding protein [Ammoniphilus sp. YIM 78166]
MGNIWLSRIFFVILSISLVFEVSDDLKFPNREWLEWICVTSVIVIGIPLFFKIRSNENAKLSLNKIEETLSHISNTVSDLIFLMEVKNKDTNDYQCVMVNAAYLKVSGLTAEQVIGKKVGEIVNEESAFIIYKKYREAIDSQQSVRYEESTVFPSQTVFVETTLIPIFDEQGKCTNILGISHDITDRKRSEEYYVKSEKLAVLGQLAAGIAHEIRNPLTTLIGFVTLFKETEKNNEYYYDLMLSELNRINFIVSEFLLLSKPQSKQYQQKDIIETLHHVIEIVNTHAIINKVEMVLEVKGQIPFIWMEENQLKQVFINVLKNAIESMPNGGRVIIELENYGESQVSICIVDEGTGIPEDLLSKLGEPFYTTKEKGTGLGLMVSHKIIENHRGTIEITSKLNVGTCVKIILPVEI